jgi:hypothetical protein
MYKAEQKTTHRTKVNSIFEILVDFVTEGAPITEDGREYMEHVLPK